MIKGIDCHIHTFYQRCGNETLTVPAVIRRAEALGLRKIALTDHLNNFDRLDAFKYIKADIEAVKTEIEVFFGVELNYMSCGGEFAYNEKIHEDFGFEVVIGGIHSAYTDSGDPGKVLGIQQEHFIKTMENPLLDVLVHPFWFPRSEIQKHEPEFWENLILSLSDDFINVLAEASRKNKCAVEVNAKAIFFNPFYSDNFKKAYTGFLTRLNEKRALFTAGSDAHDINSLGKSYYVEGLLNAIGVPGERLWTPEKTSRKDILR